jgi:NAD(P)-dependent dehydrogenase (short-subunit alcohol dehydrogenase family)
MTFGATSTTDDVLAGIDLTGTLAVVTGASAGLGEETTRALSEHGATVIMAVRDVQKGEAAKARVLETVPDAALEVRRLELGNLASVRAFAESFLADHDRLDLLINNAGVMACPQGTTDDGFELQLGTNHLGHFLLGTLLAPALVAAAPSRLISLSSDGHRVSDIDLDDPWFETTEYDPWVAYGRSKTANVLFAVGFEDRYGDQGVHAIALHPGAIHTELGRHLTPETTQAMLDRIKAGASSSGEGSSGGGGGLKFKSIPEGAATTCWAATSPELEGRGGIYLQDCQVAEVDDGAAGQGMAGVRSYAVDPQRADELWAWSEQQVSAR